MAFQWLPGEAPRVAVACDDGVVRIFTAEGLSPGLTYARSMPALGSRLLSVAWHPSGKSVLVGTAAGTLHSWDLASSRELLRINVGAHSIPVQVLPVAAASAHSHACPLSGQNFVMMTLRSGL